MQKVLTPLKSAGSLPFHINNLWFSFAFTYFCLYFFVPLFFLTLKSLKEKKKSLVTAEQLSGPEVRAEVKMAVRTILSCWEEKKKHHCELFPLFFFYMGHKTFSVAEKKPANQNHVVVSNTMVLPPVCSSLKIYGSLLFSVQFEGDNTFLVHHSSCGWRPGIFFYSIIKQIQLCKKPTS